MFLTFCVCVGGVGDVGEKVCACVCVVHSKIGNRILPQLQLQTYLSYLMNTGNSGPLEDALLMTEPHLQSSASNLDASLICELYT